MPKLRNSSTGRSRNTKSIGWVSSWAEFHPNLPWDHSARKGKLPVGHKPGLPQLPGARALQGFLGDKRDQFPCDLCREGPSRLWLTGERLSHLSRERNHELELPTLEAGALSHGSHPALGCRERTRDRMRGKFHQRRLR